MQFNKLLVVSYVRAILNYLLDVWAVILSFILQHPTSRYSRRLDSPIDNFESIRGKFALVVEDVTGTGGLVRYSGVNWKAKISDEEKSKIFKSGEEVLIASNQGNLLIIYKR